MHPEPVSVVIPTFNDAAHVGRAVDSVLAQTRSVAEVIVVDDGSSDDTSSVLREFAGRITQLRTENRGASAARNRGVEAAKSEWIAFLDSDDIWLPEKIERQMALARAASGPVVLVYCQVQDVDERGSAREIWPAAVCTDASDRSLIESWACLDNLPPTPAVVARREALLRAGLFPERLSTAEDLDLWVRLLALGRFVGLREVLVQRLLRSESLTHANSQAEQYASYLRVLRDRQRDIEAWAGPIARRGPAFVHTCLANVHHREGRRWSSAWHALRGSLRGHPRRGLAMKLLVESVLGSRCYSLAKSAVPEEARAKHA